MLLTSLMVRDHVAGVPDALAVHAPSDVICGGFDSKAYRAVGDPGWQAWDCADRAWTWRGSSDDLLPTTPIAIEAYEGPIFISHGTKDTLWSYCMSKRLAERLKAAGRKPELHLYEGQGHFLDSDGENIHHDLFLEYFSRTL